MPTVHNAIKYFPNLIRGLARITGMGEDEEGTGRVGETLQPIVDPWRRPDWLLPIGVRLWALGIDSGAPAAGQFRRVRLFLPADAPYLAIVTEIVAPTNAVNVSSADDVAVGVVVGTFSRRDGRIPSAERPLLGATAFDVAAAAARTHTILNDPQPDRVPWVISRGTNLLVTATAADSAIGLSIAFEERLWLPGERA